MRTAPVLALLFVTLLTLAACENVTASKPLDTDSLAADTDTTVGDADTTASDNTLPDTAEDIDTARPDEDTIEAVCVEHGDCSDGMYCERGNGFCDGPGVCAFMPEGCDENYDPVCGCDGATFPNACAAAAAGSNIRHDGPCGSMIPCTTDKQCTETEFCAKPFGACAEEAQGACDLKPVDCDISGESALVCGCDGTTYLHPCLAYAAGVNVDREGACEGEDVCMTNDACAETEFCKKAEGVCGNYTGLCEPRPEACPMAFGMEICGCDGNTYIDECNAHAVGMNVAFSGACEDAVPRSSLTYSYRADGTPQVTAHIFMALGIGETLSYSEASTVEKVNGIADIVLRVTYGNFSAPAPGQENIIVQLSLPRTANVPYAVNIDGGGNYVRWLDAMGNTKGELVGVVTITAYDNDDNFPDYTVTALDFFGEQLVPK